MRRRREGAAPPLKEATWLTPPADDQGAAASGVDAYPDLPRGDEECIVCRDLACGHGREPVLSGVDCALGPGQSAVLLGANGSGKTTLLSALLGLTRLHAGGARLCGARVRRGATWRLARQAALVLQNPDHQLRLARVRDEVGWGAADAGALARELAGCGLRHLAERHPLTLSFGERRRVTIAAALARRPRVLLLDEPTVGQDDHALARLLTRLQAYRAAGGCLVVATHDERAADALAGSVWRCEGGRCCVGGRELLPPPVPRKDPHAAFA